MNDQATLAALDAALRAIGRKYRVRFLWLGAAVQLGSAFVVMFSDGPAYLAGMGLMAVGVLVMLAGNEVSRRKEQALFERHGLACLGCRKTPRVYQGLQALGSGFCPHCQRKY